MNILLWLLALIGLYLVYSVLRGRSALRFIESANASIAGVDYVPVKIESFPPKFLRTFSDTIQELRHLGYKEIVTGARFKLRQGGADTHYQIWASSDGLNVIELSHIRLGLTSKLYFAILPFSGRFGPVTIGIACESFFDDHLTAITSPTSIESKEGFCEALIVPPKTSVAELISRHNVMRDRLAAETSRKPISITTAEKFFEKENYQRQRLKELADRRYSTLRETSDADTWDPKGRS